MPVRRCLAGVSRSYPSCGIPNCDRFLLGGYFFSSCVALRFLNKRSFATFCLVLPAPFFSHTPGTIGHAIPKKTPIFMNWIPQHFSFNATIRFMLSFHSCNGACRRHRICCLPNERGAPLRGLRVGAPFVDSTPTVWAGSGGVGEITLSRFFLDARLWTEYSTSRTVTTLLDV